MCVLQVELQQHLALCLPGVATTVANAEAAGPLNGRAAVVAADGATDGALPAAVPLRVSTQPQPPQPRKAALPAPGSAGAMSRKQANAFFSAARPREPTPAGADIAADAMDGGAGAGPTPAAAPIADAAAGSGSGQQPCTAPADILPVAGPVEEDMDLADDGNGDGDGTAPPPPPLHSPPVDAAAHEASSPAVSPLPMAAPPPPPPCDLEKVCAATCQAADARHPHNHPHPYPHPHPRQLHMRPTTHPPAATAQHLEWNHAGEHCGTLLLLACAVSALPTRLPQYLRPPWCNATLPQPHTQPAVAMSTSTFHGKPLCWFG